MMTCLECAGAHRDEQASGVCGSCGAAVCAHHAHVLHYPGHQTTMGGAEQPPRRELRCGFCAAAHPGARRADDPAEVGVEPCGHDRCLCPAGAS